MSKVAKFAKGQKDCRDGKKPASKNKYYLSGYGFQYEIDEKLSKGVYKS